MQQKCKATWKKLHSYALKNMLECLFQRQIYIDTIENIITSSINVSILSLDYEALQVDFDTQLDRIRTHLHIRSTKVADLFYPNIQKTTQDDLRNVLENFDEILRWIRNESSCLEYQLTDKTPIFPTVSCKNPWGNSRGHCGFPSETESRRIWY